MNKLFYTVILIFSVSLLANSQYYWEIHDDGLAAMEIANSANNTLIYKYKNNTNDKLNSQITLEANRYRELKAIKGMKENLLSWTKTVSDVFVGIKKVDEIYNNCTKIIGNYNSCRRLLQLSVNEQTLSYESFVRVTNYIKSLDEEYKEVRNLVGHLVVNDLSKILTKREEKELNMDEGNRLLILYRINDTLTEVNNSLVRMRYTLNSINRMTFTTNYDYEDFIFLMAGTANE